MSRFTDLFQPEQTNVTEEKRTVDEKKVEEKINIKSTQKIVKNGSVQKSK